MTRTEYVEMLLRLSESIDIKDTQLKRTLYNYILLTLDIFETASGRYDDDRVLAAAVIREVGQFYHVSSDYHLMKSRKRELVQARQIAMTLILINTKLTLECIGIMFSGKDHATVLHAKKTVNNLFDTDKGFRYNLKYLVRKLELKY